MCSKRICFGNPFDFWISFDVGRCASRDFVTQRSSFDSFWFLTWSSRCGRLYWSSCLIVFILHFAFGRCCRSRLALFISRLVLVTVSRFVLHFVFENFVHPRVGRCYRSRLALLISRWFLLPFAFRLLSISRFGCRCCFVFVWQIQLIFILTRSVCS